MISNKEKQRESHKRWVANNKDKNRIIHMKKNARWRKEIHPLYVKSIAKSTGGFTENELNQYPEIINIVQLIIKIKRLCKISSN